MNPSCQFLWLQVVVKENLGEEYLVCSVSDVRSELTDRSFCKKMTIIDLVAGGESPKKTRKTEIIDVSDTFLFVKCFVIILTITIIIIIFSSQVRS